MAGVLQQLIFPTPRTWGGRRPGAGRKLAPGRRPGVPHVARPPHVATHPVHVTLRATHAIHCLRSGRVFPAVSRALTDSSHADFRIIAFSVQDDHVHLIAEADDSSALSRGIRGLTVRVARGVNRALGRHGAVWEGRYHARALTSPRAVRHCLIYVLMNRRKHCATERGLDPCSSAPWFRGWRQAIALAPDPAPVVAPRTWLATVGWQRHGLLDIDEHPRAVNDSRRR
jgi:REP-associated tyrosine transposase